MGVVLANPGMDDLARNDFFGKVRHFGLFLMAKGRIADYD
jgi:hypothetical protein